MNPRSTLKSTLLLTLIVLIFPALALAQRHDESIRVKVRKSEDGKVSQIEDQVPATQGEDLEELLKKYGVEEELGELQPGEEVEITIRRKTKDEPSKDVTYEVDRERAEERRAFLGVHYEMAWSPVRGSHVTKVMDDTPAEKAGLQDGDVITEVDGERLNSLDDLARIISGRKAGEKVRLTYIRDGKKRTANVTLGALEPGVFIPDHNRRFEFRNDFGPGGHLRIDTDDLMFGRAEPKPFLGVTLMRKEEHTSGDGTNFSRSGSTDDLAISGIAEGSTASEMGLRTGDVITAVNGKPVRDFNELTEEIGKIGIGGEIRVDFERDGNARSATGILKGRTEDPVNRFFREFDFEGPGPGSHGSHRWQERDANGRTIREFNIVIRMDEVSAQEAQAISERSGQRFSASSNLDVRGMRLGPNPGNGMFNLGFELPGRGDARIQVIDMNGNVIYDEVLPEFTGKYSRDFDISRQAKGVYFLQITQNGKAFTRKIVTQ